MISYDCSEFIIRHPLRYLCPDSSVDFFLKQALLLSDKSIEYLSLSYKIPVSPQKLEEILKTRKIVIEKQNCFSFESHRSWHLLAWTDPDKDSIHLHQQNLEKLAELGSLMPGFQDLSLVIIQSMVLSHELFHILYNEIEKPFLWNSLKESEQIIIEEIAARLFSIRLSGLHLNPFILDELIDNSSSHDAN